MEPEVTRVCNKCGEEKPIDSFRLDKRYNIRRRECRQCESAYRRNRKEARRRAERQSHKEYMQQYRQQPMAAWKNKVRADTRTLVVNGFIKHPGCCECCGVAVQDTTVQIHHCSYLVCDDVLFLCTTCHTAWHTNNESPPEPDKEWVDEWFKSKLGYPNVELEE